MEERTLIVHLGPQEEPLWNSTAPHGMPGDGEVHLWFATLEELRPQLTYYNSLLDPVETERAQRFRFKQDRERFILGHGVLRELLGTYFKRDGSLIRFTRGPFGKPYLERKKLRFNFSDTKDAILLGFTTGQEIGVDIETMVREVDHAAVSEHYFSSTEIASIQAGGTAAKRRFLEYWTRKEAVLKASGVGIMDDLRVLRVDAVHNVMTIEHEAFVSMAAPEYHLYTWNFGSDHLASLATPAKPLSVQFRRLVP